MGELSKGQLEGSERLKGLKGYSSLSNEDRQEWLKNNPSFSGKRLYDISKEYQKKNFIDYMNTHPYTEDGVTYSGEDLYNRLPQNIREPFFKEHYVRNTAQELFGNGKVSDEDFNEISQLSTSGLEQLINSGYKNTEELNQKFELVDLDNLSNITKYLPSYNSEDSATAREKYKESVLEANKGKLLNALANDNRKLAEDAKEYSKGFTEEIQKGKASGQLDNNYIDEEFEKTFSPSTKTVSSIKGDTTIELPGSMWYNAFKDREELADLTETDKSNILGTYKYIMETTGDANKAMSVVDTILQDHISENQNFGDHTKIAVKGVGTKAASSLNQGVLGVKYLDLAIRDREALNNFMQGLDKDGNPLPDKDNLEYWNDVYLYNTFDKNEINKIKANNGITPYKYITKAGKEYTTFGAMFNEAVQQGGNTLALVLPIIATQGFSTLLGAVPTVGRALSLTVGAASNLAFSLPESTMEAKIVYDQVLQEGENNWLEKSQKDAETFAENEVNSGKYNKEIEQEVIKRMNLQKANNKGKEVPLYIPEDTIKNQVTNELKVYLANDFINNAGSLDKEKLQKEALKASGITFGIFMARNAIENFAFKDYLFDKGTRQLKWANRTNRSIEMAGKTAKQINKKLNKALAISTPFIGGGISEYNDSLTEGFAAQYALNDYNNITNNKYSTKSYIDGVEFESSFMNNFMAGLNGLAEAATSKEAFYEAVIGALGSGITVSPAISPKSQVAKLNKSLPFQVNRFIKNPLVSAYFDETERQALLDEDILAYNAAVSKFGTDYRSSIGEVINNTQERVKKSQSTLDSKDIKERTAYNVAKSLALTSTSIVGKQNEDGQSQLSYLKALARGSSKSEEVQEAIRLFMADPNNKSIKTEQEALERIKSNSSQLLKMVDRYTSIADKIGRSDLLRDTSDDTKDQLIYEMVMDETWKERLSSLRKDLTGSSSYNTSSHPLTLIASKGELIHKINTLQRRKKGLESYMQVLEKSTSLDTKVEGGKSLKELKKQSKQSLKDVKEKIKSIEETLDEYTQKLESYKDSKSNLTSVEELKSLNPEELASIIENKSLYSKAQQRVITEYKNELAINSPDYLQKVKDAGELFSRIKTNGESITALLNNPKEFDNYVNHIKEQRSSKILYAAKDHAFRKFEKTIDRLSDMDTVDYILTDGTSEYILKDYIEAHPDKKDVIQPLMEVRQYQSALYNVIDSLKIERGDEYKKILGKATYNARTLQEAISSIEDLIDIQESPEAKITLDRILEEAKTIGYARDVTKVRKRENELKRKEKLKEEDTKRKEKKQRETTPTTTESISKTTEKTPNTDQGESVNLTQKAEELIKEDKPVEEPIRKNVDVQVSIDGEVQSPTLDEEVQAGWANRGEPKVESPIEENPSKEVLGNKHQQYSYTKLQEGTLEEEIPYKEGSTFSTFYNFIKSKAIKLQEIVDNELGPLLPKNKNLPIHFMTSKSAKGIIFNVIEYNKEVEAIHNKDRGGIITDSTGKQWLIVGTSGYTEENTQKPNETYNTLHNQISKRSSAFFNSKEGKSNEYYVDPIAQSKVKLTTSGHLIHKEGSNGEIKLTKLGDLFKSIGKSLKSAKFFIQTDSGGAFSLNTTEEDKNKFYTPSDMESNVGRVFVFIPTPNGNFIPGYIETPMLKNLEDDSPLKELIVANLVQLNDPNYNNRVEAIKRLCTLLHLSKDGANILIGNESSKYITLRRPGLADLTYAIGEEFDTTKFLNDVEDSGFRIHISAKTLSDPSMLELYNDSGALLTNLTRLSTVGMTYTIHPVDSNGKPIIEEVVYKEPIQSTQQKEPRLSARVNNKTYTYNKKDGVWINVNTGKAVEKGSALEISCLYNYDIRMNNREAFSKDQDYTYYVYKDNNGDLFLAKRDSLGNITILSSEDSKSIIDDITRHREAVQREQAAREALGETVNLEDSIEQTEEQQPPLTNEELIEEFYGPLYQEEETIEENTQQEQKEAQSKDSITELEKKPLTDLEISENLPKFESIMSDPIYGEQLASVLLEKNWGITEDTSYKDILQILSNHNVSTANIPENVQDWINLIKDCR